MYTKSLAVVNNSKFVLVSLLAFSFLATFAMFPTFASANESNSRSDSQDVENMSIQNLIDLVAELQKKLKQSNNSEAVTNPNPVGKKVKEKPGRIFCITSWDRDLKRGDRGEDVKRLQQFLNANEGTSIANSGYGSEGSETDYFGPATEKALADYKMNHKLGGRSVFDSVTRKAVNSWCGTTDPVVAPNMCPLHQKPLCKEGETLVNRGVNDKGCSLGFSCVSGDITYTLEDVSSVKVENVKGNNKQLQDGGYSLYTIKLKNNRQIEVKIFGYSSREMKDKAFQDSGYNGDVTKLMKLAVVVKDVVKEPTKHNKCMSFGRSFKEGDSLRSREGSDGKVIVISDASFVCRSGEWKIEGSYPEGPVKLPKKDIEKTDTTESDDVDLKQCKNFGKKFNDGDAMSRRINFNNRGLDLGVPTFICRDGSWKIERVKNGEVNDEEVVVEKDNKIEEKTKKSKTKRGKKRHNSGSVLGVEVTDLNELLNMMKVRLEALLVK